MTHVSAQKIVTEFFQNKEYKQPTTLCAIMDSYGSDKGSGRHNFTKLYSKLFESWKNQTFNFFELGIGTNHTDVPSNMGEEGQPGASLKGWALYFPKANIYGADIDKRVLFDEDRIKTYFCDQLSSPIIRDLFDNTLESVTFDIIIEDGLHEFEANLNFLLNTFHKLKSGGLYIVEDLDHQTRSLFLERQKELSEKLKSSYMDVIDIPHSLNRFDNSLLLIQK
jgi:hypothetical protein